MSDYRKESISQMDSAGIKHHLKYLHSIRINRNIHIVDGLIANYTMIYNQKLTTETKKNEYRKRNIAR